MAQAIQMQRKNDSGVYENYYPNTVMSQVEGNLQMKAKVVAMTGVANQTITISGDISQIVTTNNDGSAMIYLPYGNYTLTAGSKIKSLVINAIKVYNITFFDVESVLNDNDWATISNVSNAGLASSYWNVGDTKTIVVNGRVGNTTFSNLSIDAYILGINHNAELEGNNRIHFCIGKVNSKTVGLIDSRYNEYLVPESGYFTINYSSDTNNGGWNGCYMRNNIMQEIKSALSTDLQNVLKTVTKYTDNTGGGNGSSVSFVTATTETICLEAEFEVHGVISYANSYEQNKQKQYDYYKNGNSKLRYKYNNTNSAVWWWNRSPSGSNPESFCVVQANGTAHFDVTGDSQAIAPCFYV